VNAGRKTKTGFPKKAFGNDEIIFPLRKRGIQGDLVFDNGC
jgi:hypothetical protein